MTSPQTTSQATELADKPVQSMDIWQAYAAAQDEIAALKRDRAAVIEAATEEQVTAALEWALEWMRAHNVDGLSPFKDYPPLKETISGMYAAMMSVLPQAPATDAARGVKTVAAYVMDYEFRGDGRDYSPTDDEREIIEDAIEGYLALTGGQHG